MSQNIYAETTASIIAAIEAGEFQPRKWIQGGVPRNGATQRHYSGVNTLLLWLAQHRNPTFSSEWMTYRQAQERGAQVRKGEKGHRVVFWSTFNVEDAKNPEKSKAVPFAKSFTVFNTAQIDGLPESDRVEPTYTSVQEALACTSAESLLAQAKLIIGSEIPFYRPSTDEICMPEKNRFSSLSDWYSTALHELCHWTGHKSRLDRDFGKYHERERYAREELVAELGSAFLGAFIGLDGQVQQHASYLNSWLAILKSDDRAIFKAAAQAQKAADFIKNEKTEPAFEEAAA